MLWQVKVNNAGECLQWECIVIGAQNVFQVVVGNATVGPMRFVANIMRGVVWVEYNLGECSNTR